MKKDIHEGDIVLITGGWELHEIPVGTEVRVMSTKYFTDRLRSVHVEYMGQVVFVNAMHINKK